MTEEKNSWEYTALVSIITLMAGAFLWMLVSVLYAPDVRDPLAGETQEEPARRVQENPREYFRGLNIHGLDGSVTSTGELDAAEVELDRMIPEIPDSLNAAEKPMEAMLDDRVNRAFQKRLLRKEDDLLADDEEDAESSGWGWLADEIAKNRSKKDKVAEDEQAEEDAADEEEEMAARLREKDDGEKPVYFMDEAFSTEVTRRDPFEKPSEADAERSGDVDTDDAYDDAAASTRSPWDAPAGSEDERGITMRDPFSSDRAAATGIGDEGWSIENDSGNFSGINFNSPDDDAFTDYKDRAAGYNYGIGGASERVIDSAANRYGGFASGGDAFSSDSMFRSGGGYTPAGVSAYASDAFETDAGVFGSPAGSLVSPIATPSVRVESPGASSFRTPSSSSLGTSRGDEGIATPKTLPW